MGYDGRLAGKTALVTGGALGIGRSACMLMAREGAQVVVTDVLAELGLQVVEEIQASGGRARFKQLDVSREREVEETMGEVVAELGKLDVLVNNAGIAGVNKPTHEISESEWDVLMPVNVKGVFFCTKHAVRHMRHKGEALSLTYLRYTE